MGRSFDFPTVMQVMDLALFVSSFFLILEIINNFFGELPDRHKVEKHTFQKALIEFFSKSIDF